MGSAAEQWLTYSGSYSSQRFSRLREISNANVDRLVPIWVYQTDQRGLFECSPLVVGETMYVTLQENIVVALDAASGRVRWRYEHPLPSHVPLCCGRVNRGLAISGNTLYMGTIDAHVVALDARTGKVVWDVTVANPQHGYSITSAPLVVKDKLIVGIAGGEFGIRGFLDAYDLETGTRVWRFWTIPEPGEPGNETWEGESWKTGGGATWMTGSYDAELDLIYWGIGNPGPVWNGDGRAGDNLYTNSLIALVADTGRLRWHFQFTPHDVWDWDSTEIPVLVDRNFRGKQRKLVLFANRNGFFYVLDRETGEFLLGKAFAKQTWAKGLDDAGRPLVRPEAIPTEEGVVVWPVAATNWNSSTYSPLTGFFYVPVKELPGFFTKRKVEYQPGARFWGGAQGVVPEATDVYSAVRAIDPETGDVKWDYRLYPSMQGLLSTAGGLVFGGSVAGPFYALDAKTGQLRWEFQTGGRVRAAPITYESGGRQHVAIAAGGAIFVFGLPSNGSRAMPEPAVPSETPVSAQEFTALDLLEKATFATVEWPGQPTWAHILVHGEGELFEMTAHPPGSDTATTLRVPIGEGEYRLRGGVRLREESAFPVLLRVALIASDGKTHEVFRKQYDPAERALLDERFDVPKGGTELSVTMTMAGAATNRHGATLYFEDLRLIRLKR
ncbi:MAG: PQQ-dependent dehydrogenase, methanol/ethanol family [Planctomycetota bacterium]|nr:PQQ-dependent dehydrogenase, methanol/ethanol family [Planctomycetota bacterium]